MVHFCILHSLCEEIFTSFLNSESPNILWEEFKERYDISNGPMLYELLRDIYTLEQGSDSVRNYYSKLTQLWSSYESKNPPEEYERNLNFLMGFYESFHAIRGVLILQTPLPQHGKLYLLIMQEEKQKGIVPKESS